MVLDFLLTVIAVFMALQLQAIYSAYKVQQIAKRLSKEHNIGVISVEDFINSQQEVKKDDNESDS